MEAFISLSPESTYSTDDVYRLSVEERNCYYQTEVKLKTMQQYSYVNCLAECRSELIYNLCGCIPYFLPNNGLYPMCQIDKIMCVLEHRSIYNGALPGINRTVGGISSYDLTDSPCRCLPDCNLFQYPSEITTGFLNRTFAYNSLGFL